MKELDRIIQLIHSQASIIQSFDIERLSIFGSIARNNATVDSDVDLLVKFRGTPTFDRYMDLKFFLEDLLERPVDLVTEDGLRAELKPYIEQDLIRVA